MSINTRRDYLCAELTRCMGYIVEALISHGNSNEAAPWTAAWQLGSEDMEYKGEGKSFQLGTGTAMARVEFTSSSAETRDEAAGRAAYIVERCVQAYKAPMTAFETDLYKVNVTWMDTGAVIPSFDKDSDISGKVFIIIKVYFNIQWKRQR